MFGKNRKSQVNAVRTFPKKKRNMLGVYLEPKRVQKHRRIITLDFGLRMPPLQRHYLRLMQPWSVLSLRLFLSFFLLTLLCRYIKGSPWPRTPTIAQSVDAIAFLLHDFVDAAKYTCTWVRCLQGRLFLLFLLYIAASANLCCGPCFGPSRRRIPV